MSPIRPNSSGPPFFTTDAVAQPASASITHTANVLMGDLLSRRRSRAPGVCDSSTPASKIASNSWPSRERRAIVRDTQAMARLHLALLGGFQARLGDAVPLTLPTRKTQALLAFLALPAGRSHPRDKPASLLWGGFQESQARGGLRQSLFTLRKAMRVEPSALVIDGDSVALDPRAVDVDVAEFECRIADGTPAGLDRAVALYRGELLD